MTSKWISEPSPRLPRGARRPATWITVALLAAILLCGAYFRTLSLFSWDGTSNLHPDERFLTYTAYGIAVPRSIGDYFQSACNAPGTVANPKNPSDDPKEYEPTIDSGCNTLNPRNYKWSRLFVYGTLPTNLTRLIAEQRHQTSPDDVRNVGRTLSVLFDMGTILLAFLVGQRLYSRRVGLLAAAFYALAVLPIQLSHFFTVDSATGFFTLLSIYWAIRVAQGSGWGGFVALGLSIGGAMACRVTMATLGLAGLFAVIIRVLEYQRAATDGPPRWRMPQFDRHMFNLFMQLVVAGVLAAGTFRVLQPDAFMGSKPGTPMPADMAPTLINRVFQGKGIFDVRPEPRFLSNIREVSGFVSGETEFPPGQQWGQRTPFWFSWKNMVLWGMGLPLGVLAWLGWAVAGWQLLRRRMLAHLIPVGWIGFYFLWQGGQFVMTMRYYALLYGLLAVFAAWLLVTLYDRRDRVMAGPKRAATRKRIAGFATGLTALALAATALWAFAFTRIYTDPHSRIMASRWIYDNIPPGSKITNEQWDDPLPVSLDGHDYSRYVGISTFPYAEDDESKYIGGTDNNGQATQGLLDQLDQADYVILSSNRVYDSATRMPMRYPALTRYYHYLFSGELGFTLAADIHSYPRIFGIEIPTPILAEEAFSVYDHPRVLIFHKTPQYSRATAEKLITDPTAWTEVYKLPTLRASRVPTALRLTDQQWPLFRASGTWASMWSAASIWNAVPWLPWIVVLELLGLAMWALLFRVLRRLPDRGFALAKTLGLLVVAYVGWLLASIGSSSGTPMLSLTPWSARGYGLLLLALGGVAAWRNWPDMRAFVRQRRMALLSAEGLFLLAFFAFVLLRAFNPDLWHPARGGEKPMDLAFLTAVLKSPSFPPYDPWFAGGYLNYYYFGFVLVGTLIHITGIVPATAYNLAVPTMFALTALGAWGVAYNLVAARRNATSTIFVRRARSTAQRLERRAIITGLVAAVFVTLAGNLAQATWYLPGTANPNDATGACAGVASYAAQQACRGRAEWAFWDATRIVGTALHDSTINEFPFFTFLYGDLHAHMIALPLALAVLGVLGAALKSVRPIAPRDGWRRLLSPALVFVPFLALLIGALRATNTWDYPAYLGISVLALGLAAWRERGADSPLALAVTRWIINAAALWALCTLLFLPFTRSFATDYTGVQRWEGARTPIAQFVQINGFWLFLLLGAVWLRFRTLFSRFGAVSVIAPLLGLALLLAAALGLFPFSVLVLLVPLLVGGVAMLAYLVFGDDPAGGTTKRISSAGLLLALFAVCALGLALVPELITSKGDAGRMNTVFKLGMESWVLFALSAAVAATWLWQQAGKLDVFARFEWRGAVALLGFAALLYPLTATPARLADRFSATSLTLDGTAFMQNATWSEGDKTFPLRDDADALAWMQRTIQGTPIVLEAQTDAYHWGARVATYTGLPTLLGWPGHEGQQRSVAQVDPVLQSRQAVIQLLYNDPGITTTLGLLHQYGVEYVYVGQMERALYDPAGLNKFDAMAAAGQMERVYDHDGTRIYHLPPASTPPAVFSITLPVQPPTMPPGKSLLLDRPVDDLLAVNEYAWNPLGRSSWGALALWLVAGYALLLLGLPLALLVFGRWRDGGWAWARLIGLLLLGYAVWLPVSARLWQYNRLGLALGVAIVLALDVLLVAALGRRVPVEDGETRAPGVGLWFRSGMRVIRRTLAQRWRAVLQVEALFLAGFGFMALLRALNPDLWQPAWGGEKPFEFGFLNAMLRSPVMPPYNPFFSDGTVNYYYYGFFLMSLPIKATGILPAIGFNLAVATLFGLLAAGAFALVAQLTGRARYGVLGVFCVAIIGNSAAVFATAWSAGFGPVRDALLGGDLSGFGTRLDAWFIGPSRVIPNTINEFPYWSFLFADLHPHMIALPITLLALALAWTLFTDGERRTAASGPWFAAGLAAVTVGALAITNSWDFPTAMLLIGGGLLGAAWRRRAAVLGYGRAVLLAVAIAGGGLLLYLPFFQNFQAMVRGVGRVSTGSDIRAYVLVYGLFLAVLVPALFGAAWRLLQPRATRAPRLRRVSAALGFAAPSLPRMVGTVRSRRQQWWLVLLVATLMLLLVTVVQPIVALKLWLGLLVLLAALVLLVRRTNDATWFAYWMALVGWAVSLGFELVFVRDHLADGDWQRMNTVFKFGLQAWVLFGLATAVLLPRLLRGVRRINPMAESAALAVLIILGIIGLAYPLAGTPSRVAYRFPVSPAPTLDGLAFMDQASYDWEGHQIELRFDADAIRWLNEHVSGTPVVLQSSNEFYRAYGVRIAANTGLPTVVSPLHENEQRDPAQVGARDNDVREIYMTDDANAALRLLSKYRVQYLYVGPIERAAYGEQGTAKFDLLVGQYLDIAYRNAGVKIFAVRPEVRNMPGLPAVNGGTQAAVDVPTTPADQATIETLEAQVKANPHASGPAFSLALRYREAHRLADAAAVLGQAATFNPTDVALHHLWGDTLRDLGQVDDAIIAYRLAAQAEPTSANLNKLGTELFKFGKFDDARLAFEQTLKASDTETEPYFFLGRIYQQQGDNAQARTNYETYLRVAPDGKYRAEATSALEQVR